ncbi:MAG: hypothetical protein IJU03_08345 [Thermoguttaceae bacterium]|nr:hypothetical protein [Thermoguttaceae bacterium]
MRTAVQWKSIIGFTVRTREHDQKGVAGKTDSASIFPLGLVAGNGGEFSSRRYDDLGKASAGSARRLNIRETRGRDQ